MIAQFLNRFKATPQSFLKELYKRDFDGDALFRILDSKKFTINHQDEDGNTFLHLCILRNKFKSAKWLISNGIDVTLKNNQGLEPIELAIQKQNHLIVELILKAKKIDINQVDGEGRSLLQNAVLSGNETIANDLIKHAIDINHLDNHRRNVLFDAVSYGNERILNKILDQDGLDLNVIDINGETILHKPEALENEDLCIKLIQKGADPTICDKDGKNLLYYAAIKGMDGSRLLDVAIEHGCNINAKVTNNNTLLMETLSVFYQLSSEEASRRESMIKMANNLISKGIDVNAINDKVENSLFDAVRSGDYDACALLLNNGIDVNLQNKFHQTPLLVAVYKGIKSLDIIILLLKHKANPTIRDDKNRCVLEILNELILYNFKLKKKIDKNIMSYITPGGQYFLVLKEIIQNSIYSLEHYDSKGQPLFFAPLLYGHYDLFKLYITLGFDINMPNKQGLNIFFVYVYTIFQLNKDFKAFRSNLIGMIRYGADINAVDKNKTNVFSAIIQPYTNFNLFETLVDVVLFDYYKKDNKGRTVAHHAVLNKNYKIVQLVYDREPDVLNLSDGFGILPIMYAALIDCFEIVEYLLDCGTINIKAIRPIPKAVKERFAPRVAEIDKLKKKTKNKDLLRKITILTDQIKQDFAI